MAIINVNKEQNEVINKGTTEIRLKSRILLNLYRNTSR